MTAWVEATPDRAEQSSYEDGWIDLFRFGVCHSLEEPMSVAVIGGLLVSTLVTLVLIPCVYATTDRWRKRGKVAQ